MKSESHAELATTFAGPVKNESGLSLDNTPRDLAPLPGEMTTTPRHRPGRTDPEEMHEGALSRPTLDVGLTHPNIYPI